MLLQPFQSGCVAQMQMVRLHSSGLCVSVGSHTNTPLYFHQLFVLQHHSWHSNFTEGRQHVWCQDYNTDLLRLVDVTALWFSNLLMYGLASQTGVTVVSKFPLKTGEPCMHKRWIPGTPLWFFCAPGNRASEGHSVHPLCYRIPSTVSVRELHVLHAVGAVHPPPHCPEDLHHC